MSGLSALDHMGLFKGLLHMAPSRSPQLGTRKTHLKDKYENYKAIGDLTLKLSYLDHILVPNWFNFKFTQHANTVKFGTRGSDGCGDYW